MKEYTDLLIVGGGFAGLYAAVAARQNNPKIKITMLVPSEQGLGGCSRKTHGINAAMNPNDSWQSHLADTIKGGGNINNPKLAEVLCTEIIDRMKELESWGVRFESDGGQYQVGTYGGSTVSRSLHYHDFTGLQIIQNLVNRVILSNCFVKEHRWAAKLIVENGVCLGVAAFNLKTGETETYIAQATILATGGGACVYPIATISGDKLGSGILMAYEAGAQLVDMEMVQFHPTGLVQPGTPGHGEIMEEEIRNMGAVLLNKDGERYMFRYDSRGELATRDVVARSSYIEIIEGRGTRQGGVYLDITKVNKQALQQRLPYMVERIRSYGVDFLTADRIEISPSAHYLMGGMFINEECQTSIKGLFACGEDAGGIHGGNRIGGNGVADALVFGYRAGAFCGKALLPGESVSHSIQDIDIKYFDLNDKKRIELNTHIKELMWNSFGLVRDGERMKSDFDRLKQLKLDLDKDNRIIFLSSSSKEDLKISNIVDGIIIRNKLLLSLIIAKSALIRSNSVGAHFRVDNDNDLRIYNIVCDMGANELPNAQVVYQ